MTGEGGVVAQGYRAIQAMFVNLSDRLRLQFKNPSFSGLQGSIDGVHAGTLRGLAHAGDGQRLALIVKKNGAYVGECTANAPRADLAALGIRGWTLWILATGAVRLCCAGRRCS